MRYAVHGDTAYMPSHWKRIPTSTFKNFLRQSPVLTYGWSHSRVISTIEHQVRKHHGHLAVAFMGVRVCVPCKKLISGNGYFAISWAQYTRAIEQFLTYLKVDASFIPRTERSRTYRILADSEYIAKRNRREAFFKMVRHSVKMRSHTCRDVSLAQFGFIINHDRWGLRFNRSYSSTEFKYINSLIIPETTRLTDKLEFNGHAVFKLVDVRPQQIGVMLIGRDSTGQNWAHTLPPMAWNWSIETCEKWLFADIPIARRNPKMITEIVEQT